MYRDATRLENQIATRSKLREIRISLRTLLLTILTLGYGIEVTAGPPSIQQGFPIDLLGDRVRFSSLAFADVDGDDIADLIVGTADGVVHAYRIDGTRIWDVNTGAAAIESKAAVGDVDADGFPEVVVSAGSTFTPTAPGGLWVISHTGEIQCSFTPQDTNQNGIPDGVYSSPALADLDGDDNGRLEIAFGSWDFHVYALHDDCSVYWSLFTHDTIWSSPTIADLDHDGSLEVVIGTDTNSLDHQGGRVYVFDNAGGVVPGWPVDIDEVVWSSPAVADLNRDNDLEIVVGTGYCWDKTACAPNGDTHAVTEAVYAFNRHGIALAGWPALLHVDEEYAIASPAIGDVDGDGLPEIAVNTVGKSTEEGRVYLFQPDGSVRSGWPVRPSTPQGCSSTAHNDTQASPVIADIDGDGDEEVLLVSTWEVVVWDGAGTQLTRVASCPDPSDRLNLVSEFSLNSSPLIDDLDGDGDLEVAVGGARSGGSVGAIYAWDLDVAAGFGASWPQFRHDSGGTGVSDFSIFIDGFESALTSRWD